MYGLIIALAAVGGFVGGYVLATHIHSVAAKAVADVNAAAAKVSTAVSGAIDSAVAKTA